MRARPKLEEPWTFFTDECIGRRLVPDGLVAMGLTVVRHHERFSDGTNDVDWLPIVGEQGLVLITKDKAIAKKEMEIAALAAAGIAAFFVPDGTAKEQVGYVEGCYRAIQKALRRFHPPFIGRLTPGGDVVMIYCDGKRPEPGVVVKGERKGGK